MNTLRDEVVDAVVNYCSINFRDNEDYLNIGIEKNRDALIEDIIGSLQNYFEQQLS